MYFGDYHRIEVKHLFDYITTDHNAFNISAIDKHMFVWVLYIYIYIFKKISPIYPNRYIGKMPWRRKWQCTPIFLPGKCHGQRSLVGYSPWGHRRVGHDLATKKTNIDR